MLHPSSLCQLEFHTYDLERSIHFFSEVLGWSKAPITLHEYVVLNVPDDNAFGISLIGHRRVSDASRESSTAVPYFRWDADWEELVSRIEASGGRLLWGPRTVPAYGRIYGVEDPGGIRLGFYCPL